MNQIVQENMWYVVIVEKGIGQFANKMGITK